MITYYQHIFEKPVKKEEKTKTYLVDRQVLVQVGLEGDEIFLGRF